MSNIKSWDFQKELIKRRPIPSQDEIYLVAKNIESRYHRLLYVVTYLTAGRINEVVRGTDEVSALRKRDIKIIDKEKDGINYKILMFTLKNEKNKWRKFKEIPINISNPKESRFFDLIWDYLESMDDMFILFDFSRPRAYNILRKYGVNPHYMRHVRLTHLGKLGFSDQQLVHYAGWTDSRPAKHYIQLDWTDLIIK
jgi:hypothetical protein